MAVLFSRLVENETNLKPSVQSPLIYTESACSFVTKHYLDTNDEYNNILLENMRTCYFGSKAEIPEIITEGFTDAISNIIAWFKKWRVKFKNFVVKCIHKLIALFKTVGKMVDKFEESPKYFTPFTVEMYEYTIPDDSLATNTIDEYFDMVLNYALEIAHSTNNSVGAVLAEAREATCSAKLLDMYRGKTIKQDSIPASEYKDAVKRYFHNGSDLKKQMEINMNTATTMCKKFKQFHRLLESVKKNRIELEKNCNLSMAFIQMEKEHFVSVEAKKLAKSGHHDANDVALLTKIDQALTIYFDHVNLTVRNIHLIFDKYYSIKIDTLKDALKDYGKTIDKVYVRSRMEGR